VADAPDHGEIFLREVNDEMRYEAFFNFFRRYGKLLAAAVVTGLVGYAGVLFWQNHMDSVAGAQGVELSAALQDIQTGNAASANKRLTELSQNGQPGYKVSAKLLLADLALGKGDKAQAVTLYGEIAQNSGYDENWRNLALVRQTAAEFDTMKPEEVVSRLQPLLVPEKSWYGMAGEMVAAAYVEQGKKSEAGQLLQSIAGNEHQPEALRHRVALLANQLGYETPEI
jgi:hypothetical protein